MADHDGFFNTSLDDGTRIKLGALGWFLSPWSSKLGQWDKRGTESTIWYVDGFAGPGKYTPSGELGSPLIAATHALRLLRKTSGRPVRLSLYNVEDDSENYEKLERSTAAFQNDGVRIINKHGKFADYVDDIVETTVGSPVLLFIDPWGFTGFEFESIAPLLTRDPPIDIILRLNHKSIPRLRTQRANLISATVGAKDWEEGWESLGPEKRIARTLEAMKSSYVEVGDFLEFHRHPVRVSLDQAPDFTLGFASRSIDAFRIWNDKLGAIERELHEKAAPEARGQGTLFDVGTAATRWAVIKKAVFDYFESNPDTTWQSATDWFMFNSSTRMMDRELSDALKEFRDSREIEKTGATWQAIRQGTYRVISRRLDL